MVTLRIANAENCCRNETYLGSNFLAVLAVADDDDDGDDDDDVEDVVANDSKKYSIFEAIFSTAKQKSFKFQQVLYGKFFPFE